MKKVFFLLTLFSFVLFLSSCVPMLPSTREYTVTFNSNGGTLLDAMEVRASTPFLPNEIPLKEGYTFGGWYLDANFYYPMSFNTGTKEAVTLYAKWILIEETLSEEQIRSIIDSILLADDFMIADETTITNIVNGLIDSNELIDETAVIAAVLANIDVVELFEAHVTEMIADVRQSVVMIDVYQGDSLEGGGSGVIYKKVGNTYYVVTNEHVIQGFNSNQIEITIFNKTGDVVIPKGNVIITGTTTLHDMAVLTFTTSQPLRVIEMGTKENLKVAQMVFAIGSPFDLPNGVSMGVISYIDRFMEDDYGMKTFTIQHTAPINRGNSGGALVDIYGRLIGLNNMSYVDDYLGEGVEALHFAIQIDVVKQIIPTLE